jgi:hypothetical protein
LILQVIGSKGKNLKNLLPLKPLELLNLHTNTLGSCTQALRGKSLHIHTLPRRGNLAGGEIGPEEANKQGGKMIGLTSDRFAVVARPERGPVKQWRRGRRGLDSGEMPTRLGHQVRLEAHVWAREKLRFAGLPRERAEQQGHRRC